MADDLTKQIANLRKSMASGILTVEDADNGRVTYRTYGEMRQALSDLLAQQQAGSAGSGAPRRTRQVVMTSRSGW